MTARNEIFRRIERALEATKERAAAPAEASLAIRTSSPRADLWSAFSSRLRAVNGVPIVGLSSIGPFLEARDAKVGYCDPQLYEAMKAEESFDGIELHPRLDRDRIDAYAFGITRASGAIAETGTVILTDADTSRRLGALAPWVHIAVLSATHMHRTIKDALAKMPDDPSVIWATGPSKTADVEGILIEGAHGPGVQAVCLVDGEIADS